MIWMTWEVGTSVWPPVKLPLKSSRSPMTTTASTIHSSGPRKIRRKFMTYLVWEQLGPSLLPAKAIVAGQLGPSHQVLKASSAFQSFTESLPPSSGVDVGGEGGHGCQIPVTTVVVEPVANDELVRNVETDVGHIHGAPDRLRLAERGHDFEAGGASGKQVADQIGEGQARVDDVLNDQHVHTGDVGAQILENPYHARGLGTGAVRRYGHPVHPAVAGQGPGQVRHHHHGTIQHTDQQQVLALVVAIDIGGQLDHPRGHLLLREEHAGDVTVELCLIHSFSLP